MDSVSLQPPAMCGLFVKTEFDLSPSLVSMTAPRKRQSLLLALPSELRARIYEHLFFNTEVKITQPERDPIYSISLLMDPETKEQQSKSFLTALWVCHQMRREAHQEFLRSTQVRLDCDPYWIWGVSGRLYRTFEPRFRMRKLVIYHEEGATVFLNDHISCYPDLSVVEIQYRNIICCNLSVNRPLRLPMSQTGEEDGLDMHLHKHVQGVLTRHRYLNAPYLPGEGEGIWVTPLLGRRTGWEPICRLTDSKLNKHGIHTGLPLVLTKEHPSFSVLIDVCFKDAIMDPEPLDMRQDMTWLQLRCKINYYTGAVQRTQYEVYHVPGPVNDPRTVEYDEDLADYPEHLCFTHVFPPSAIDIGTTKAQLAQGLHRPDVSSANGDYALPEFPKGNGLWHC